MGNNFFGRISPRLKGIQCIISKKCVIFSEKPDSRSWQDCYDFVCSLSREKTSRHISKNAPMFFWKRLDIFLKTSWCLFENVMMFFWKRPDVFVETSWCFCRTVLMFFRLCNLSQNREGLDRIYYTACLGKIQIWAYIECAIYIGNGWKRVLKWCKGLAKSVREGLKRKAHSERGLLGVGWWNFILKDATERCCPTHERARTCSGKPDPVRGHALFFKLFVICFSMFWIGLLSQACSQFFLVGFDEFIHHLVDFVVGEGFVGVW